MEDGKNKVTLKEKLFFGWADVYGGGAQALIGAVYMMFLIAMGISPTLAGVIVGVSKAWDAISDPLMGVISDNTRTKYGRRRPYLFFGGFLIMVSLLWLFAPVTAMTNTAAKFVFFLSAYLFYNTVSTVINVPYSSMSTEISVDLDERTGINTIRLIFSMISGAVSALAPTAVFNLYLDGKMPISMVSYIFIFGFGLFYSVPVILAAVFSKERVTLPKEKSKFSFKTFFTPFKVKGFVFLLVCYFCSFVCIDIINANMVYFIKYALGSAVDPTIILAVIMVVSGLTVPVIYILMKKGVAKSVLFRAGLPLFVIGVGCMAFYFGKSTIPLYIFAVIAGLGLAGSQMIPWILFPDVIDVAELKLGDRPTGSFSGVMTFIRKASSALATVLMGAVLDLIGFVRPETDPATGKVLTEPVQPFSAQMGMRLMVFISVLIFMGIAFYSSVRLKLSPARSQKIKEFLSLRQEGVFDEISGGDKEEYEKIKKDLF